MSCREKRVKVQSVSHPVMEELTGNGATAVQMTQFVEGAQDFNCWIAWLTVTGEAAAPANLPTAFRIYGVKDSGSPVPILIVDKCFENADGDAPTDWNGKLFLEIDETDLGSALGDGDASEFTALQIEIVAPATKTYNVSVQGYNAEFASEENIAQQLTYA